MGTKQQANELQVLVESLSKEMYSAYGESAGWKNFSGGEMPAWFDLPQRIRDHWGASAMKAVKVLKFFEGGSK